MGISGMFWNWGSGVCARMLLLSFERWVIGEADGVMGGVGL